MGTEIMMHRKNVVIATVVALLVCLTIIFLTSTLYSRNRHDITDRGRMDLSTEDRSRAIQNLEDSEAGSKMSALREETTEKSPESDFVHRGILYPDFKIGHVHAWKLLGKSLTDEQKQEKARGEASHAFNQFVSKRIGFARYLPDTRPSLCNTEIYPPFSELPTTSVIICFHNEDYTTLLRTVYMTLLNSPPELVKEIILIDDASTMSELKAPLQQHADQYLPKVRIERTSSRQGLIRARLMGARLATGDTITFLDSHCETNVGWLEPLLARLKEKPRSAVMPIIEIINQDTMEYQYISINLGGFTWDLVFKWDAMVEAKLSPRERMEPRASPTMAGGLFSIYREFFFEVGSYDQLMDVWGGENLEISFRLWMCAGGVELIPCSKVGHIFRKRRPYSAPGGDSFGKNNKRLAEVWMDGYKELLYKKKPYYRDYMVGSIEERVQLRERLKCKSFSWYLHSVYPLALQEIDKDPDLRNIPISE